MFFAVTGFTLSLVAVPFLMPVLGPKETVVFIIFGTFLAKVVALWNTRRDFEWHTVLVTVFGSIMGSIPGGYVLNAIPAAYLQILLGIMLLAVYAALPLLLGMWLGERCFHKINQRLFIQLSKAFVVIGACTAFYRGITALM